MTVDQALTNIYITPLNQKGVDVNVKDLHYIKHTISDIHDKDLVSTTLAMLSKVNFISMLYFASNKTIEAKHIVSLLSKFFVETLVIDIINDHLKVLSEPLLSTKIQSPHQTQVIPIQQVVHPQIQQPQVNPEIQQLIQLDLNTYQKYTIAKKQKTPAVLMDAELSLQDLIQMHEQLKHQQSLFPQTLHFKKPKINLNYIYQLKQGLNTYTPPYPSPNYRPKRLKKHKFFRLISQEEGLNSLTLLFGLLMIIPFALLAWIPSWWILWSLILIPLFLLVGLSLFTSIVEEREFPLLPVFFIVGAIFAYMWLGPSFTDISNTWQSFVSILPTIGIWTIGIVTGLILWLILYAVYFENYSPGWFWFITFVSGGILMYLSSLEWYLYAGIVSASLILSSLIGFVSDLIEKEGIGILGLLITAYYVYFTYEYFYSYGFFR
jgi:hypothetical protein